MTPLSFWLDFLGVFITLAGYILGLGGVTVIEFHAFLGRTSSYWTEATIRTHKITKPMIWTGLITIVIGSLFLYRETGLQGIALWQLVLGVPLALNGLYLTFKISPYLLKNEEEGHATQLLPQSIQKPVFAAFLFSFVGWWTEAALFAFHLVTA